MAKHEFEIVYANMVAAAKVAVVECVPVPMVVGEAASIFGGGFKPGATLEVISDGVCGSACVWFKGNTAFGRWAKAQGHARESYPNGLQISAWHMTSGINQSMAKAEAAASAAAKVLREAGIHCYMQSRID